MKHTPECFAGYMGLWCIEPIWLQRSLSYIKGNHDFKFSYERMEAKTREDEMEITSGRGFDILDGNIAGVRRSLSKARIEDWSSAEREEVGVVNQFGLVRIPNQLREKYKINNYVKFIEDEENNRLYLISADEEET